MGKVFPVPFFLTKTAQHRRLFQSFGGLFSDNPSNPCWQDLDESFNGIPDQIHQPDPQSGFLQKNDGRPEIVPVLTCHSIFGHRYYVTLQTLFLGLFSAAVKRQLPLPDPIALTHGRDLKRHNADITGRRTHFPPIRWRALLTAFFDFCFL